MTKPRNCWPSLSDWQAVSYPSKEVLDVILIQYASLLRRYSFLRLHPQREGRSLSSATADIEQTTLQKSESRRSRPRTSFL